MKKKFLLICVFISSCGFIYGQDLVYKPINPAFGGDTFNYQWLLSAADAQNDYKEETDGYEQPTDLERFKSNLNNQLLNKISNSLFDDQFGDGGIDDGTYTFGTLSVDVYQSNLGTVVDVLDTDTGEQTQVIIPGN